jgi:hypothetical protein
VVAPGKKGQEMVEWEQTLLYHVTQNSVEIKVDKPKSQFIYLVWKFSHLDGGEGGTAKWVDLTTLSDTLTVVI